MQDPVVQRPISTNMGLHFNPDFFFFCSKALSKINFSFLLRASNYQSVDKKNSTEFAVISEFNFPTKPGLSQTSFEQPCPGV